MKRVTVVETGVFVGLVAGGVALRVGLQSLPNFAPVAALALFAGYFFRSRSLALAAPLLVMAISDTMIGGYGWQMMALVYGALALPVFLRGPLRRYLSLEDPAGSAWKSTAGLVSCSLATSIVFFVTTNLGCWWWYDLYPKTAGGLLHCYVQAIPFFRYTLTGDLLFACLLFGGYAAAMSFRRATDAAAERLAIEHRP